MEKKPRTKNTCLYFLCTQTQRAREYFNMVGNVLLTSVYTCLMGRFGTEPLAPSLLRHLLTSSMTLESTPLCVVSRTASLLGERHRLKSSGSIAPGTSLELVPHAKVTRVQNVVSYLPNFARAPVLVWNNQPLVRCW